MAERSQWSGAASDFLLAADRLQREEVSIRRPDWPRSPRALAGRLRRAQTSLRAVGIDIAFQRAGRAGSRVINMRATADPSIGTVGGTRANASKRQEKITTPSLLAR